MKNNNNSTTTSNLFQSLKLRLFFLSYYLIKSHPFGTLSYLLLLLIEIIQMSSLAFVVHWKAFKQNSASRTFYYVSSLGNILNLFSSFKTSIVVISIIFGVTAFQTVGIVYFLFQLSSMRTKIRSELFNLLKIVSGTISFSVVLFFPFMLVYCRIYYMDEISYSNPEGQNNYFYFEIGSTEQIFITILASFLGPAYFISGIYFTIFLTENIPDSELPWTSYSPIIRILKQIAKICQIFIFILDPDVTNSVYYMIGFVVLFGSMILLRLNFYMNYRAQVLKLNFVGETFLLCIYLTYLKQFVIEENELDFYMFVLFSPIIALSLLSLLNHKMDNLVSARVSKLSSLAQIYCKFYWVLFALRNRSQSDMIDLFRCSSVHQYFCTNPGCPCKEYSRQLIERDEIIGIDEASTYMLQKKSKAIADKFSDSFQKRVRATVGFVMATFNEVSPKFSKTPTKHLLSSYLNQKLRKNPYLALYDCTYAEGLHPSLREELLIFIAKYNIQNKLKQLSEMRQKLKRFERLDLFHCILYLEFYNSFNEALDNTTQNYLSFWELLRNPKPNSKRINIVVTKFSKGVANIKEIYQDLNKLKYKPINFLLKYSLFVKHILQDQNEASKIQFYLERVQIQDSISESNFHSQNLFRALDQSTALIRVSGNDATQFKILDANSEVVSILKIDRHSIIGKKVTAFIPEQVANLHDYWMSDYHKRMTSKRLGNVVPYYLVDGTSYISSFMGYLNNVPLVEHGIEYLLFLKAMPVYLLFEAPKCILKLKKEAALFVCTKDGNIIGINEEATKYFGFTKLFCSYDLTIDKFIPFKQFLNISEIQKADGDFGYFNTELISQFTHDQNDDISFTLQENTHDQKNDTSEVKAWIKVIKEKYGGHSKKTITLLYYAVLPLSDHQYNSIVNNQSNYFLNSLLPYDTQNENGINEVSPLYREATKNESEERINELQDNLLIKSLVENKHNFSPANLTIVKKLQFSVILLIIILIGNMSADFWMKKVQIDSLKISFNLISATAIRYEKITNVATIISSYENLIKFFEKNDYSFQTDRFTYFQIRTEELANEILEVQNSLEQDQIYLDSDLYNYDRRKVRVDCKDKNNELYSIYVPLQYFVLQYIHKLSEVLLRDSLEELQEEYLNGTSIVNDMLMYYLITNGLLSLRQATEASKHKFLSSFLDNLNLKRNVLIILSGIGIFLTLCCMMFIILKIWKVAKHKERVISIFSYITDENLLQIIQHFQHVNFEENYNKVAECLESEKMFHTNNINSSSVHSMGQSFSNAGTFSSKRKLVQRDISEDESMDNLSSELGQNTFISQKITSLKRSSMPLKIESLIRISILVFFIIGFLVFNLCFTLSIYSVIDTSSIYLGKISNRKPYLVQQAILLREAFFRNKSDWLGYYNTEEDGKITNGFEFYYSETLALEDFMLDLRKREEPTFIDTIRLANQLNSNQFCTILSPIYTQKNKTEFIEKCKTVDNGSLQEGLRISIFRAVAFIKHAQQTFLGVSEEDRTTEFLQEMSKEFQTLQAIYIEREFISVALDLIYDQFLEDTNKYFSRKITISFVESIAFLIGLISLYLIVFINFIRKIKVEILQINGMLNMIPPKLIQNNLNLQKLLLSSN